jgi:ubiquinone/menaquinone biosynthesis C-methylase UbiE
MDDESLVDVRGLTHNLRDIARYNTLLGANALMLKLVRQIRDASHVSGLDIGIGSGDFIAYAAQRLPSSWVGLDLSPRILSIARAIRKDLLCDCANADATHLPFVDGAFDVVTCALTVHHLQPSQVTALFRECARVCKHGFAMVDFQRSYVGLAGSWLLTRLTSTNTFTRNDGVQSIRRAYTMSEVRALLADAGLSNAEVRGQTPIRYSIIWKKL